MTTPSRFSLIKLIQLSIPHEPVIRPAAEADEVPVGGFIVGCTQNFNPAGLKAPFGIDQQLCALLLELRITGVDYPAMRTGPIGCHRLRMVPAPAKPGILVEVKDCQRAFPHQARRAE